MDNMFALGVTILTVLANAVLGLVIVRRNYRSATNRLFGLLTFIISIWAVLNYFSLQTVNPIEALFWIRAVMVSVAVMFPVIYLLAWVFPYVDYKVKGYLSFVVVLSTLFMVALSASPLIFEAVKVVEGKITPVPGRLIFLFGIHVIVYLLLTLVTLIQKKKATGGIYGAQIMMMSLGLGFTFVTSFITTFIFVVGSVDILIALIVLLKPIRAVLLWAVFWGFWTALVRPLVGEPIWDFVERWANWGAPLALLLLRGWPRSIREWLS